MIIVMLFYLHLAYSLLLVGRKPKIEKNYVLDTIYRNSYSKLPGTAQS